MATCVLCHEQHFGQTKKTIPRDDHRTTGIGTDLIVKMTEMIK